LPGFTDHDADRRPGQRDEPRGNRATLRAEAIDEGERAAAAAEYEDARLVI